MPRPTLLFPGSLDSPNLSAPPAPSGGGLASQGIHAGGGGSREILKEIHDDINQPLTNEVIASMETVQQRETLISIMKWVSGGLLVVFLVKKLRS